MLVVGVAAAYVSAAVGGGANGAHACVNSHSHCACILLHLPLKLGFGGFQRLPKWSSVTPLRFRLSDFGCWLVRSNLPLSRQVLPTVARRAFCRICVIQPELALEGDQA